MFIEHKNSETNKWNLVKNSEWSHNMVPIDRNSGLFIFCAVMIRKILMNFP